MMAYAERTQVPFNKSITDIMTMLRKAGADQVGQMEEQNRMTILFAMRDRRVRFRVTWEASDAAKRQRARALLLVIKAKLESIESGVETFEEAFLANIVTSNNDTVYERISEDLAIEAESGSVRPFLLGGPSRP